LSASTIVSCRAAVVIDEPRARSRATASTTACGGVAEVEHELVLRTNAPGQEAERHDEQRPTHGREG
jgi:hypothetical protein